MCGMVLSSPLKLWHQTCERAQQMLLSTGTESIYEKHATLTLSVFRKGKEHADLTRANFNMAADVTVGGTLAKSISADHFIVSHIMPGFRTFDLVSMYYKLIPKLAIKVGAGALTYDPYKQDALHGSKITLMESSSILFQLT